MPTTRVNLTEPGRLIFGLMTFTVGFSVVGGEIEKTAGGTPPLNPAKIIFGGTVATSLLTLLSHGGEVGERLAVGLAFITFATASLVYGKPVWDAMNKAFGTKPTTPITTTTPTTNVPAYVPAVTTAAIAG